MLFNNILKKGAQIYVEGQLQLENGKMNNLAKINIQLKLFFKVTILL